jgi:hypothetical protein
MLPRAPLRPAARQGSPRPPASASTSAPQAHHAPTTPSAAIHIAVAQISIVRIGSAWLCLGQRRDGTSVTTGRVSADQS